MAEPESELSQHVERSVEAIVSVHREHARRTGPLQRIIDRTTAFLARPAVIATMWALVLGWLVWNGLTAIQGQRPPDPPPFAWLGLAGSLAGVGLASLILASQRRQTLLDEQRSQLTLQLSILNDQKTAKLIGLLEELRRDSPAIADRNDPESEAMSQPADTEVVLEAIQRRATEPDDPKAP